MGLDVSDGSRTVNLPSNEARSIPQISGDSFARLVAISGRLLGAVFTTIVVARWLGPEAKGTFSTLHYMAVLLTYACSLGLGEATIILLNRGEVRLERALSAAILPVIAASAGGAMVLVLAGVVAGWGIWDAVLAASLFVLFGSLAYLMTGIENARLGLRFTSKVALVSSAVTVLLTVLLVGIFGAGIAGAISAVLVAAVVSLGMLHRALAAEGVRIRPKLDLDFLKKGLRVGASLEGAHLLTALAQRADLLIVYWLAGEAEAGVYSISLTVGQTSSYAAAALAYAAFPRVASAGAEWASLAKLTAKMATLVGTISTIVLATLVPLAIPVLLGPSFEDAVLLSLVLLAAGVVWGVVATLARSLAGAGYSVSYVQVFAVTLMVMLLLDLILVPAFGAFGAAWASLFSISGGLILTLIRYRRVGVALTIIDLVPGKSEIRRLALFTRGLVISRR